MFRTTFRSMFCLLALLILLPVFAATTRAQRSSRPMSLPVQVHGQVRYAAGARPAEFVMVRLESFRGGLVGEVITDRSGKFMFTGLLADLYIVTIRTPGYNEVQQEVDLRTQPSDYVMFQLVAKKGSSGLPPAPPRSGAVVDASVPAPARAEFEKGRDELLQRNNTDEGIAHLEKALSLYPKYLQAKLLLAAAYMDKKEWTKAETMLLEVLTLGPKTAEAHFALGEIYLRQKRDEEAEKVLLQGLQIEDRSFQGHLTLSRVYWDMASKIKDETQARPYLEKSYDQVKQALSLNPNLAHAHLLKGYLLLRVPRAQDALTEFEAYLRLEPQGEFSGQVKEVVQKIKRALAKS
jgi:thioredoxin-like negative regulator of GroEL